MNVRTDASTILLDDTAFRLNDGMNEASTFLHVITVDNLNATKGRVVGTIKYNSRITFKLYIYICIPNYVI